MIRCKRLLAVILGMSLCLSAFTACADGCDADSQNGEAQENAEDASNTDSVDTEALLDDSDEDEANGVVDDSMTPNKTTGGSADSDDLNMADIEYEDSPTETTSDDIDVESVQNVNNEESYSQEER